MTVHPPDRLDPAPVVPLAGLVLCGGDSRRMGGDKAVIEVHGRRLVEVVAERLGDVASPVVLASGSPGRLRWAGYEEVADVAPAAGPLAGLAAGLQASPHELVAVVAVDMPFLSAALFRRLADLRRDEDVVVPVTERGPQALHAVWAQSALHAIADALERRELALHDLLARLRVRRVERDEWAAVDPEGRFATNLNRPADLDLLRGLLG